MTFDPTATPPVDASHRMRWLDLTALSSGLLCALFTGQMFWVALQDHHWGSAGRPEWTNHAGAISVALSAGLILLAVANTLWQTRWATQVSAMARDRLRGRYLRGALLFFFVGLLCAPVTLGLHQLHQVPILALGVIFLGTMATVMSSSMIGYYRLQSLTRTQQDLLLQSQLAPHFLFNSLSTLKGQIAEEPSEAQVTADRLSRLFRELMDMGRQSSVPLSRELAFVESYLGLEQARLGQRLKVHIQVPDDLENQLVPPLCLQVLVENAVRHAIAPRLEGGLLSIRAFRVPAGLQVVVGDPGTGRTANPGTGRGLQVLRARLARPSDLTFQVLPEGHQATLVVRNP